MHRRGPVYPLPLVVETIVTGAVGVLQVVKASGPYLFSFVSRKLDNQLEERPVCVRPPFVANFSVGVFALCKVVCTKQRIRV